MMNKHDELRGILRAHDPVVSIASERVARVEQAIMNQIAAQKTCASAGTIPHAAFLDGDDRKAVIGRMALAAMLLVLGFWTSGDVMPASRYATNQTAYVQSGVSKNLPLLAMASPWQNWIVESGEE